MYFLTSFYLISHSFIYIVSSINYKIRKGKIQIILGLKFKPFPISSHWAFHVKELYIALEMATTTHPSKRFYLFNTITNSLLVARRNNIAYLLYEPNFVHVFFKSFNGFTSIYVLISCTCMLFLLVAKMTKKYKPELLKSIINLFQDR